MHRCRGDDSDGARVAGKAELALEPQQAHSEGLVIEASRLPERYDANDREGVRERRPGRLKGPPSGQVQQRRADRDGRRAKGDSLGRPQGAQPSRGGEQHEQRRSDRVQQVACVPFHPEREARGEGDEGPGSHGGNHRGTAAQETARAESHRDPEDRAGRRTRRRGRCAHQDRQARHRPHEARGRAAQRREADEGHEQQQHRVQGHGRGVHRVEE